MVIKIPIYVEVPNGLNPSELRHFINKSQEQFSEIVRKDYTESALQTIFEVVYPHLKETSSRILTQDEVLDHMRKGF